MNLKQAESILNYNDVEGFTEITRAEMYGSSRWSGFWDQVYHNIYDNTYWKILWERGLTEIQDEGPQNITVKQVNPVTKTITVYK